MNLSGLTQYSKAVSGMRSPNTSIDKHLKLMFIYPILIANKIKVQSSTPFETLVRDFISVTFLNDIFIENAIQMVSTANQIKPLWDESGAKVNPAGTLLTVTSSQISGQISTAPTGQAPPIFNVESGAKYEVQQKIQQKTAVIQQYLKSDPKLSRFRPYIEMITLGNMIDVPVIAGTTAQPIDTLTLFHVIVGAIGLNKPLNSMNNVEDICAELENLTPEKYFRLISKLFPEEKIPWRSKALDFMTGLPGGRLVATKIVQPAASYVSSKVQRAKTEASEKISKRFPGMASVARHIGSLKTQKSELPTEQYPPSTAMFGVLNLLRQNLDQTKLFFKFVLDEKFAASRYGINPTSLETQQSSINAVISSQLSRKLGQIIDITLSSFQTLIGATGNVALRSISNVIMPEGGVTEDFSDLKSQYIDQDMINSIAPKLTDLMKLIEDTVSTSDADSLKDLCNLESPEVLKDINELILNTAITSTSFKSDEYGKFLAGIDRAADLCGTYSGKFERLLSRITYKESDQSGSESLAHLKTIKGNISAALDKMFQSYSGTATENSPVKNLATAKSELLRSLTEIYYFILLSVLQENLCKFIIIANVEIETATNEVTSWPNYTLVIPIEIITALHAAIMGKGWNKLIKSESGEFLSRDTIGQRHILAPSEDYVKGIIQYISTRLDVPNLIVVDGRRGRVYYKLMNSSSINNTNISTFETFVQSIINKPLGGSSGPQQF